MPRNYKEEYQKWKDRFASLTEEEQKLLIERRREEYRKCNKKRINRLGHKSRLLTNSKKIKKNDYISRRPAHPSYA